MTTASSAINELRDLYGEGSTRIQQEFARTGDGRAAVRQRTALVENLALRLWKEWISPDPAGPTGFALVAIGGFGRGWLFPHSDIDLLFLHEESGGEGKYRSTMSVMT